MAPKPRGKLQNSDMIGIVNWSIVGPEARLFMFKLVLPGLRLRLRLWRSDESINGVGSSLRGKTRTPEI